MIGWLDNGWLDGWMIEDMDGWMNEWNNEWIMNKWIRHMV